MFKLMRKKTVKKNKQKIHLFLKLLYQGDIALAVNKSDISLL